MTEKHLDSTESKSALIAGLGLFGMTVPAIFANTVVFRQVLVPGSAAATAGNIIASGERLRR